MWTRALALLMAVGLLAALGLTPGMSPTTHAEETIRIDAFSPRSVAAGDQLTITGDFTALRGRRPRVFARRDGIGRKLRMRVVEHHSTRIVVEVRTVPNPSRSASDSAEWTLHVGSPGRAQRRSATTATGLVTSAPVIEDVRPDAIHAGWDLLLLVRCPGKRRTRVLFGDRQIRSKRVRVQRDVDGKSLAYVWARVPHEVGNGTHSVALKAELGKVTAAKRPKVAGCDEPPPPPPDLGDKVEMEATVTGQGFSKDLKNGFVFSEFVFGNTLILQGCFNEGVMERCAQFVNITIGYQEDSRFVGPVFAETLSYTDSSDFGNGTGSGVNDLNWESSGGLSVEVVESSSTRIKGTFRGTVLAQGGEMPVQLEVDGTFVVRR